MVTIIEAKSKILYLYSVQLQTLLTVTMYHAHYRNTVVLLLDRKEGHEVWPYYDIMRIANNNFPHAIIILNIRCQFQELFEATSYYTSIDITKWFENY